MFKKLLSLTIVSLISVSSAHDINLEATCTLGSIIAAGTPCETSAVLGLTKQIAAELNSMGIAFA